MRRPQPWDVQELEIQKIQIKPRRMDVDVQLVALGWVAEIEER